MAASQSTRTLRMIPPALPRRIVTDSKMPSHEFAPRSTRVKAHYAGSSKFLFRHDSHPGACIHLLPRCHPELVRRRRTREGPCDEVRLARTWSGRTAEG